MQDLLNGLELDEQTAGPANGMHGKHGSGTGMLISALRHIRTKVPFIANRRVVHTLQIKHCPYSHGPQLQVCCSRFC